LAWITKDGLWAGAYCLKHISFILTSYLQANCCNTGVIASNTHAWEVKRCKEQGEHIDNQDSKYIFEDILKAKYSNSTVDYCNIYYETRNYSVVLHWN